MSGISAADAGGMLAHASQGAFDKQSKIARANYDYCYIEFFLFLVAFAYDNLILI